MEHLTDKVINFASILDDGTRMQAIKTGLMPFIYPHLALMPDAHLGKGATVGSVIPTEGAIMPSCVGSDIGCGMQAVRTQFTLEDVRARGSLTRLRENIESAIPSSAGRYNGYLTGSARGKVEELEQTDGIESAVRVAPQWHLQLGSLGSGNHFIEISVDENDVIWAFLHSGSRGVGNKLANVHIKKAQKLNDVWKISLPDPDLAYLVEETPEFWDYIRDLRWAQKFALLNRAEMMHRVLVCLADFMGSGVQSLETIACHHNYTEKENHFGRDVWLSRKGAICAAPGVQGLIPGSMGTRSYVVHGLGNKVSLNSAPHGAGRVHSRSSAKRTFSMAELEKNMAGIEWKHSAAFLDEIPGAYKDIDVVMEDAKLLVEVDHELRQLVNVKGV